MSEPLEDFAGYLTEYERLAPATVRKWVDGMASLLAFVEEPDRAAVGEISATEMSAWLAAAEARGLSSGTRQGL